jgi:hypothetical protein
MIYSKGGSLQRLTFHRWIVYCASVLLFANLAFSARAESRSTLKINDDIEIDIVTFGERGKTGIIWFACRQGEDAIEFATARRLASRGYQIYFPDMLSAHFLSSLPSNIARIPAAEVVAVIGHIVDNTSAEQLFLMASARAAVPVIRGLTDKKLQQKDSKLKGALLITPRIYKTTPDPGSEPVYIDETGLSIHPIVVLEGERTPNRWGLAHLKATLEKSGSPVQTDLIDGVRGYFFLRDDQTPAEMEMTRQLDTLIHENLKKLGAI